MKKLAVVVSYVSCAVSAFAEGTSSMPNAQSVGAIFTNAQNCLGDLLTAAVPVVSVVASGGLLVWAGISLIREVKRALYSGLADGDSPDSHGDDFWTEEDEAGYQEYLASQRQR